jgi:hypothetical protein
MGFRSGADLLEWLAVAGILILFTLALTWLAVIPGLSAKWADGASAFAYPLIFLPFISSAFVPTDTMPSPVRAFAENQPVTSIVNAIRDLFTRQPVGTQIWIALAWCVGILIVAYIFAMFTYRRRIAYSSVKAGVLSLGRSPQAGMSISQYALVRKSTLPSSDDRPGLTLEVSAGGLRCSRRSKWSRHPVNHSGPKGCKYSWTKSLSSREAHVCLDAGCEVVKEYGKLPEGE